MSNKEDNTKSKAIIWVAIIGGFFTLCGTVVTVIGVPIVQRLVQDTPTPVQSIMVVTPEVTNAPPPTVSSPIALDTATLTPESSVSLEPVIIDTPTSIPTATPFVSTLYNDNFDDNDANGWLEIIPSWKLVDGQYICISNNNVGGQTLSGDDQWTDYVVSADIKTVSGTIDGGVFGRVQDAEHLYLAQLHRGKATIHRRENTWIPLVSVPFAAEHGTVYRVSLEFRGTKINMYVNDVLVTSAEDAAYLSGKIGLRCANNQTFFDNVTVTETEIP